MLFYSSTIIATKLPEIFTNRNKKISYDAKFFTITPRPYQVPGYILIDVSRVCVWRVYYVPKYTGGICTVNTLPNSSVRFRTAPIPYRTRR